MDVTETKEIIARLVTLAKLLTIRQVISAGDEAIEAAGLNPWCINEGLATGDENISVDFARHPEGKFVNTENETGGMTVNGIDIDVGFAEMDEMPNYDGDPQAVKKAVNHAITGLLTDGGHHKQWSLEQVLIALGIDLEQLRNSMKESEEDDFDLWEEGITP